MLIAFCGAVVACADYLPVSLPHTRTYNLLTRTAYATQICRHATRAFKNAHKTPTVTSSKAGTHTHTHIIKNKVEFAWQSQGCTARSKLNQFRNEL